jgi:glycosyltransferase involved in cell wall biosynthesis
MPLPDRAYERAKCGYKLLQYAASGVPFVASPVGVNEQLIRRSEGVAATTIDEWVDGLVALLDEPATRRARRAAQGFELAAAYSYGRWQDTWIDAVGWSCASFM